MRAFTPGLELTIPLTISPPFPGATIQSFQYTIYNKSEQIVQATASGTVVNASAGSITFNAGIAANTLAAGEIMSVRWVKIDITYTDNSTASSDYYYSLQVGEGLIVGVNSFQTYTEAELIAHWIPNLDGWTASDKSQRLVAMAQAREDLCRLPYKYAHEEDQTRLTDAPGMDEGFDLRDYTSETDLAKLPADFIAALKRAQVFQADYLLAGQNTEKQRADGLMSRTVGESSEMYRPGMGPIHLSVCKAALTEISGYLERNTWKFARG